MWTTLHCYHLLFWRKTLKYYQGRYFEKGERNWKKRLITQIGLNIYFFSWKKNFSELKSAHRRTRMWTSAKLTTYKVKRNNKSFKTLRHLTRDNKIQTTGQNTNLRPTNFELLKSERVCWPYINCRMFFSRQHVINTP